MKDKLVTFLMGAVYSRSWQSRHSHEGLLGVTTKSITTHKIKLTPSRADGCQKAGLHKDMSNARSLKSVCVLMVTVFLLFAQ